MTYFCREFLKFGSDQYHNKFKFPVTFFYSGKKNIKLVKQQRNIR